MKHTLYILDKKRHLGLVFPSIITRYYGHPFALSNVDFIGTTHFTICPFPNVCSVFNCARYFTICPLENVSTLENTHYKLSYTMECSVSWRKSPPIIHKTHPSVCWYQCSVSRHQTPCGIYSWTRCNHITGHTDHTQNNATVALCVFVHGCHGTDICDRTIVGGCPEEDHWYKQIPRWACVQNLKCVWFKTVSELCRATAKLFPSHLYQHQHFVGPCIFLNHCEVTGSLHPCFVA